VGNLSGKSLLLRCVCMHLCARACLVKPCVTPFVTSPCLCMCVKNVNTIRHLTLLLYTSQPLACSSPHTRQVERLDSGPTDDTGTNRIGGSSGSSSGNVVSDTVSNSVRDSWEPPGLLHYDLLVGADGAGSAVRAALERVVPAMKVRGHRRDTETCSGMFCHEQSV
jgi:hypothetical protein